MKELKLWGLSGGTSYLDLPERILFGAALLAIVPWVNPQLAMAQSSQRTNTPQLAFEIKSEILNLSSDQAVQEPASDKVSKLRNYLAERESPLQNHTEVLLMQPNWKYVLAISHAESTMCQHQLYNNCWGIGGENMRRYRSFSEGIIDANDVIQRYLDRGHQSTRTMMPIYVGWNNPNWVLATQQVFEDLNELGM